MLSRWRPGQLYIRSRKKPSGDERWISRSPADVLAIEVKRANKTGIVALAARAALEQYPVPHDEYSYQGDENTLRNINCRVSEVEFNAWREGLLQHAREIVRLPHVTAAIEFLARLLDGSGKKSFPASEVRHVLRTMKRMRTRRSPNG